MLNPVSTYRLQFNKDFTFRQFELVIPYLVELGIRTIYASPIFEAVPGSNHGYDTVNPNKINPEIGSMEELKEISNKLRTAGISWIQDIVPNHMAYHENNLWLMDVLKNGEQSVYRSFFDIISTNLESEPLMAPFLGDDLEKVIESDQISRVKESGNEFLKYYDSRWPVRAATSSHLPVREVVQSQYYRLCNYRESNDRINYRRFFTVNSLICLNMQNGDTFDAFHKLIKELIDCDVFQGLRVDHIDGLADPKGYLEKLRDLCGEEVYIVAEKILEPGEILPKNWPLQGTTGYDFLGLSNQLLTNHRAERKFDRFYSDFSETPSPVDFQIQKKKRDFLFRYMKGELHNLTELFVSRCDEAPEDQNIYKEFIAEILIRCPVYRFYGNQLPLSNQYTLELTALISEIERDQPTKKKELSNFKNVLFGDLTFFTRLMQFTGPLMAKGVEDTLMYTFNRFIGSNEVGDSPEVFGISVVDFHERMKIRQRDWPLTINASSTHDTKRGEDARARLAVLTSLRDKWFDRIEEWRKLNDCLKVDGCPDANDEYFIYQTLVATYPEAETDKATYVSRIQKYLEKALRESKRNSSWDEPEFEYEKGVIAFIQSLTNVDGPFWPQFLDFMGEISRYGQMTSLVATILKFSCPGIPDLYQGNELWDYSMVDPDNRRPVNYDLRFEHLVDLLERDANLVELWQESDSGKIKLFITQKLLAIRNASPEVFTNGQYLPLELRGKYADAAFAFARRYQNDWYLFVLPLNLPLVTSYQATVIGREDWEDTAVIVPSNASGTCVDQLRNAEVVLDKVLLLNDIFKDVPLSILHINQPEQKRGAGILMHLSSLPSAFGIGDFGPQARAFLDFLAESGQKYWQVLPMNPVTAEQSYSPYSSISVMAGNPLFISPEILEESGLLRLSDLRKFEIKKLKQLDYFKAAEARQKLLQMAYQNYQADPGRMKRAFGKFKERESYWLDDYALYVVIREQHSNLPWYDWPEQLRERDQEALRIISKGKADEIDEVKWQQFIFENQWQQLRKYAKTYNINIIGDLPFYASGDSADVWASRKFFKMDDKGTFSGVAGVPPDYFNGDGQLWGMPVYDWEAIKQDNFGWWTARIGRNLKLYDLIRLDHFRAFSEYWEIPASAETAKEGKWEKGPGSSIFNKLKEQFPEMPFIAEDLGDISEDVYALRDDYGIPGMRVLQFAFGDDYAQSIHIPHMYNDGNCLVYTGTHDNNTVLGWYKDEVDAHTKNRLSAYLGYKINSMNVARSLIRLSYASVADIAIVPMQDILNEGAKSRMNTPSSIDINWVWKLNSYRRPLKHTARLLKLVKTFGR